jgi:hypothetical protein
VSWARWGSLIGITLTDTVFSLAASAYYEYLTKRGVVVALDMRFVRDQFEDFDPADLEKVIESRVRVVLVLAFPEGLEAIVRAGSKRRMFAAGWAWLSLETLQHAPESIQLDLSGWLYLEPRWLTPSGFFDRVRDSTATEFSRKVPPSVPINPLAANLYDAVLLYASTVRRLMQEHEAYSDGRAFVHEMIAEPAFDGMTGSVRLTRSGELQVAIRVVNYFPTLPVEVGVYDAVRNLYLPSNATEVQWPGGTLHPPRDSIPILHCPPGAFYNSTKLACLPCERGTFQPDKGRDSCISCRIFALSYQADVGMTACTSCPANTTRAYTADLQSIAACECASGYWAPNVTAAWVCSSCPVGAACFGKSALPRAEPGYWAYPMTRNASVRIGFIPCSYFTSTECKGGNESHTAVCNVGFIGAACSVCDEGYYKFIGNCKACGSDEGMGRFFNLLALAGMILAWVVVNQYVYSFSPAVRPADRIRRVPCVAAYFGILFRCDAFESVDIFLAYCQMLNVSASCSSRPLTPTCDWSLLH